MSAKKQQRQNYIMQVANELGYVSKEKVAEELETSVETIRRDINELCEKKLLQRALGGAQPYKTTVRHDALYINRVHQNKNERLSIGEAASGLIRDGMIIAFDSGTSIQSLASSVANVHNVTLVTDSLPTAIILYNKIETGQISGRVIVIGGEMNHDRCTAGAMADDEIDRYHFDLAFISCTSLSLQCVSSFNLDLCHFSRHIMKNSIENVLIAESEKVDTNSLYGFANLSDFRRIIVDDRHPIPRPILDYLAKCGTELTVAKLGKYEKT
ncbi:MAG: DeoR/GlpR transcriptional regulator [Clostridia bacterium]|nr:DeoR/GlpR transcriptional regulator [Clostridia bacterium]